MLLELVTIASIFGGQDGLCNKPVADPAEKVLHCDQMVAAHRKWPFGTHVRVCHGSRCVVVVIHDRGPFVKGRDIDLSPAAGRAIDCDGVCNVTLDRLD